MTARRTLLGLLGIGALGSQAGHLLAYQMRFGAAAQQVQSTGVHAYFPALAKTGIGLVAFGILAALLVVGLARMLGRGLQVRTETPRSYLTLFAALYTVQLAWYAAQEVVEAALAGAPSDSAAHLLLWGTLGQLPVAAVAAMALRWLLVRFERAVEVIRLTLAESPRAPRTSLQVAFRARHSPILSRLLSAVAGTSLVKRGPPSSVRFSSI